MLATKSHLSSVKPLKPLKKSTKPGEKHPELPFNPARVDYLLRKKEEYENAKTEYNMILDELRAEFMAHCRKQEANGVCNKTMLVVGNSRKATVTRKDQYTKIDADNAEYLENILDDLFDVFLSQETDAKLATDWEKFSIDAVASGFHNVQDYFTLTDYIKVKPGAIKELSKLREQDPNSQAVQVLDEILEQCQYKPSLRVKK